jgi:3',5'-cyclic AMP phosphodiesterase CpdA
VLIAQITDCHIGFFRSEVGGANTRRLRAVLDRLRDGPNRPDLLLLTGDLTEFGDAESYARLTEMLADCPFPVHAMVGNHDDRDALRNAFPDTPLDQGFIQYVLPLPGLRLIALDTLEPGRHGGAFCAERAAWLSAQLDTDPETPVVIAMHHPPFVSGLDWLDGDADAAWIRRFFDAIAGRPQVRAILGGHVHRTIHTSVAGVPLTVCPSTAPAVALNLAPADPEAPDGRAMIVAEPAAFALHRWDGERLVSHVESVSGTGEWDVLASYDAGFQELVRQNVRERRE